MIAPTQQRNTSVYWGPGEHISIVGDTGTGKTYLTSMLVRLRKYVVILRTKPDDIKFRDFHMTRNAEDMEDWHYDKILLNPTYKKQATEGWKMLNKVWEHGRWTVVIDENWYAERLGLQPYIERLLTQGRSMGISVIVGMQRPVQISRFAISQSTHLFTFRVEGRDMQTIVESTTPRIKEPIESITGHDFVYFNRGTRIVQKGNANNLGAIFRSPKPLTTARHRVR